MLASCALVLVLSSVEPLLSLRGGATDESTLAPSLLKLKGLVDALEARVASTRSSPVRAPTPPLPPSSAPALSGGAAPQLVDPEEGDRVRVRPSVSRPSYDWGHGVSHLSVGTLAGYSGDYCIVNYPQHRGWKGKLSELELVMAARHVPKLGDPVRRKGAAHDAPVGEVAAVTLDDDYSEVATVVAAREANVSGSSAGGDEGGDEGAATWQCPLVQLQLLSRAADGSFAPVDDDERDGGGAGGGAGGGPAGGSRADGSSSSDRLEFRLGVLPAHVREAAAAFGSRRPLAARLGWALGATTASLAPQILRHPPPPPPPPKSHK